MYNPEKYILFNTVSFQLISGLSDENVQPFRKNSEADTPKSPVNTPTDQQEQKHVGRSTFFDSLNWVGTDDKNHVKKEPKEALSGPQSEDEDVLLDFANLRVTTDERKECSLSSQGQLFTERDTDRTVSNQNDLFAFRDQETSRTTQLIDIGFETDDPTPTNKHTETPKNKELENFFESDFNSNEANKKCDKSENSKQNLEILVDFSSADVHEDASIPRSPSSPAISSTKGVSFDESSHTDVDDPFLRLTKQRSPSLKKNKSTSDLFDTHSEDDFFKELGSSSRSSGTSKPHKQEHLAADDLFSIRSNSVIDPFSADPIMDHQINTNRFQAFSPTAVPDHQKSSSEGDLLGDWGNTDILSGILKPQQQNNLSRTSSTGSDMGSTQSKSPRPNDPFADLGNLNLPTLNSNARASSPGFGGTTNVGGWNTSPGTNPLFPRQSQAQFGGFQQQRPQPRQQQHQQQPNYGMPAPNYRVGVTMTGPSVFGSQGVPGARTSWGKVRNFFSQQATIDQALRLQQKLMDDSAK